MWIISDKSMRELLGCEVCEVVEVKQKDNSATIKQLYNYQFKYFNYDSWRYFYNHHLRKIIYRIKFLDDDCFISKVISKIFRIPTNEEE